MNSLYPVITVFLCVLSALGEPGGTYTLTGKEKSIRAIIKTDIEKYPDLYEGEPLAAYLSEFNETNNIGRVQLAVGDVLVFPETIASREAQDAKKAAEALDEAKKKQARSEGVTYYQHRYLPSLTYNTGGSFFSNLVSGLPPYVISRASEVVDEDFAASIVLKSYPEKNLFILVFENPTRMSQCYYAAIREEESGYGYYTLEKGLSIFGTGDSSVLYHWDATGEPVKLGGREYTTLDSFLNEFE